jgi:1-acyl-sn-glycerol-3-phosphate acyltransferase
MNKIVSFLQNSWYKFIIFITRWLFLLLGGRIFGTHHIPRTGGAIIASNHQSYLDPVFLSGGLQRPLHFLARQELFEANRFFGGLIRSVKAVPLERRRFNSEGIRKTIAYLSGGELFLVFPEGTRTHNGQIQPFKPGIITMALKAGVPIIPTRIIGAYEVWPRTSLLPKRWHPVKVIYGKPLVINPNLSAQEICHELYNKISEL